jgi:hypothetical protein
MKSGTEPVERSKSRVYVLIRRNQPVCGRNRLEKVPRGILMPLEDFQDILLTR